MPVFSAVNEVISPIPFAAKPIDVLLLFHRNVLVPAPVKLMGAVDVFVQTVWLDTALIVGAALMVTTIVALGLSQLFAVWLT